MGHRDSRVVGACSQLTHLLSQILCYMPISILSTCYAYSRFVSSHILGSGQHRVQHVNTRQVFVKQVSAEEDNAQPLCGAAR